MRGRGPKEAFGQAGSRVKEFFSSHSILIVFVRDVQPVEVPAGGLTFVEASKTDAAGYERDIATDSAATFIARLGPGMHCFLAMDGSRIVHATWVTEVAAWTRELRSYLVPPEGHAYIYESYTSPAARGKGAYPFVLLNVVNWAATKGLGRLWVAVESENAASRRAVEKAGFAPAFEIAFRRSLGALEIELPKPSPDRLELRKKFSRVGG
ncbi:MAG: N-acetyltransferase family protein [Actinomycetota bacterium]